MAEPPRPPEAKSPPPASDLDRAKKRGRRAAFTIFYVLAVGVSVGGSAQIFVQAFQRREAPGLGVTSCADGLGKLTGAIERARKVASVTDGEDAALADFRKALGPEWEDRDHIEDLCRSSAQSMAALDAIEQLRYAEEHAVRREAAELAPLRRRVQAIAPPATADPGSPSPPSPGSAAPASPKPSP